MNNTYQMTAGVSYEITQYNSMNRKTSITNKSIKKAKKAKFNKEKGVKNPQKSKINDK